MTVLVRTSGRSGPRRAPAARSKPEAREPAPLSPNKNLHWSAVAVVLGGMLYNPLLAIINGHAFAISVSTVIVTEVLLLLVTGVLILRSGRRSSDILPALVVGFFLFDAVVVSVLSGVIIVDMARSGAIIALFLMIGARVDEACLKRCFLIASVLTGLVLMLELLSTPAYANFLKPSLYFENTRGFSKFELDELGLFPNALGFEGRFSLLNISDHRTASLFLEQVSLANYSTLLTIFLVAMWDRVSVPVRTFYIALIALILVSNNSRTALALTLIGPVIYYVAPKVPRLTSLLVMPMVLIAGYVVTLVAPPTTDDTFVGRVTLTINNLSDLDLSGLLGTEASLAKNFLDSGYVYVIYSMSIAGVLFLWALMAFVMPGDDKSQRRCTWLLTLYFSFNLLIGSSAIFSIKVGTLLWVLVGYLRRLNSEPQSASMQPALQPARAGPRVRTVSRAGR